MDGPGHGQPHHAGFGLGVQVSDQTSAGADMLQRPGAGRKDAVARLMALDARGELATDHARAVAGALGVSLRTVWNWVALARHEGRLSPRTPSRAGVTPDLRARLALWGGNVAAVHRELLAEAAAAGDPGPLPSLRTLQRAVRRDLSAGERAGLRGGEAARRRYDVYGKRPPTYRNACWEGDHKRIPVRVALDGCAVCPWVTWFIDVASKVIVGVAVTPHQPARDAVLAALRTGISRTAPTGRSAVCRAGCVWTAARTSCRTRSRKHWAASRSPSMTCRPTSPTARAPWRPSTVQWSRCCWSPCRATHAVPAPRRHTGRLRWRICCPTRTSSRSSWTGWPGGTPSTVRPASRTG